jgi:hypothetical protein
MVKLPWRVGDPGPALRRGTDTAQVWVARVLVAFLVAGMPLLSVWAGVQGYRGEARAARLERADRRLVVATVVPAAAAGQRGEPTLAWRDADGSRHQAQVPAGDYQREGGYALLWVTGVDTVTTPPDTDGTARGCGFTLAVAVAIALCGLCAVIWSVVVLRLDRLRSAQWAVEWARVEPWWSGRRTG